MSPKNFNKSVKILVGFWGHAYFWAPKNLNLQIRPKPKIFQYQSIDNSLLSSHKKVTPDWSKRRMPLYVIIGILRDFLAHNLTKYQYFLWAQVYSFSTIKLQIPSLFQFNISLSQFATFNQQ